MEQLVDIEGSMKLLLDYIYRGIAALNDTYSFVKPASNYTSLYNFNYSSFNQSSKYNICWCVIAGRVKRKNAKKGTGGGGDEEEDDDWFTHTLYMPCSTVQK